MAKQYGIVKIDTITFTSGDTGAETDVSIDVSGLANIADSGVTVTGTISGVSGIFSDEVLVGTLTSATGAILTVAGDASINSLTVGAGGGGISTNTALGFNALVSNTTGASNVAIGHSALDANETGNNNVAIGRLAASAATGNNNTIIGYAAGQNLTTGTKNIFLGFGAGPTVTTGSNNTIIGDIDGTAALEDTVIIGAGTAERLRIDSSGNVGIGTDSPSVRLEVARIASAWSGAAPSSYTGLFVHSGSSSTTQPANIQLGAGSAASSTIFFGDELDADVGSLSYYHSDDSMRFNINASERMRIDSTGNVGIGISNPSQKLTVSGGNILLDSNQQVRFGTNNAAVIEGSGDDGTGGIRYMRFLVNSEAMRIDSLGKVGIGTTSPASKLEVSRLGADWTGAGPDGTAVAFLHNGNNSTSSSAGLQLSGGSAASSVIFFGDESDADVGSILYGHGSDSMTFTVNTAEAMRITSAGNVGIGTSSPFYKLHVITTGDDPAKLQSSGNANAFLQFQGSTTTQAPGIGASGDNFVLRTAFTERMRITSAGNVGIGTSSPSANMHLNTTAATQFNITGANTSACTIGFGDPENNQVGKVTYDNSDNSLAFTTTSSERMRITSAGNVGIGTTSPSAPLEVKNDSGTTGETIQLWRANTGTNNRACQLLAPEVDDANSPFTFLTNNSWNFRIDTTDAFTINASANIGVRETSPTSPLHITTSNNWNFPSLFIQRDASNIATNIKMIAFGLENDSSSEATASNASFIGLNTDTAPTTGDTVLSENAKLNLTSPGGVIMPVGPLGVGTSTPDQILDLQDSSTGSAPGPFIRLTDGYSGAWTANTDSSGIEFYSADASGPGIGVRSKIANTVETTTGAAQALTFSTRLNVGGGALEERMRIQSNGNVGIGTTTPNEKLSIDVNGTTNRALEIYNSDTVLSDGETVHAIRFTQNDVSAPNTTHASIETVTSGSTGLLNMVFKARDNQEYMRIDSAGNVLIGATSARGVASTGAADLEVETIGLGASFVRNTSADVFGAVVSLGKSRGSNPGGTTIVQADDILGDIRFAGADGADLVSIGASIKAKVDGTPGLDDMPGRLEFSTTASGAAAPATVAMIIDNADNVGIGIDPAEKLHVNGAIRIDGSTETAPGIYFSTDSNTGFYSDATDGRIQATSNGTQKMLLLGNAIRFIGAHTTTTASAANVFVATDGELRRSTSSRAYKTNIEPIEDSYATNLLENAQPIYYKANVPDPEYPQEYLDSLASLDEATLESCHVFCTKNKISWDYDAKCSNRGENPDWSHWGFIAEDLAEVDPRLCYYNDNLGRYDAVQYDRMTPILLKLAQMQDAEIKSQETKIKDLEARLSALEGA